MNVHSVPASGDGEDVQEDRVRHGGRPQEEPPLGAAAGNEVGRSWQDLAGGGHAASARAQGVPGCIPKSVEGLRDAGRWTASAVRTVRPKFSSLGRGAGWKFSSLGRGAGNS